MSERTPEKKLQVCDLSISFRTNDGKVQAVRDISFDLYKGETLAIVGESGSGKSVTSKAIMGISAANAIVENGEILYDGRDLLKIDEEDFHKLRGHRLSMIFQDPLSALNPVMRIGKQLTEAMILNNKERRRDGKRIYQNLVNELAKTMVKVRPELSQKEAEAELEAMTQRIKVITERRRAEALRSEDPYLTDLSGDIGEAMGNGRLRGDIAAAIAWSRENTRKKENTAAVVLEELVNVFTDAVLDPGVCRNAADRAGAAVNAAIDPLALEKDNMSRVFYSSVCTNLGRYFDGLKANPKERERFAKDTKKYEALVAAGKFAPSVVPMNLIDTDRARQNIVNSFERLSQRYRQEQDSTAVYNDEAAADAMVLYLMERVYDSDFVLTEGMAHKRAIELMTEVGIPEPERRYRQYSFELSGGMRQRIVIAIALSANPDVLICDEPTTALDVTIQAQILELINKLKKQRNLSIIFITHDLGVVANMADRIAVMYAGKIVEYGKSEEIFYSPAHPYTWALLSSMPDLDTREKLEAIPGTPPNMIYPPEGDAFAARNRYAMQIDFERQPPQFKITDTHWAATWLLHPNAPKIDPPAVVTERIERMKQKNAARTAENENERGGNGCE